jgi:hypothetical protein
MPRAKTDLAVPRGPTSTTPPKLGSTAANNRASLAVCWPTTAVRGKVRGGG